MRRFELLRWNSFFLVIVFLALFYLVAYSFFVRRPQQEVVKIFFADRITAAHRYLIDKYNALNAGTPSDGATLVLHSLEPKHPSDGQRVELKWRSG